MPEENGDRSQEATPHRRQQAREEGNVVKSHDLASAALLLLGVGALLYSGGGVVDFLAHYAQQQLGGEAWLSADAPFIVSRAHEALGTLAGRILPVLGLLFMGAVLIELGQVGFLFLPEKLMPDLTRLDPLKGLQRMFSLAGVVRLAFGLIKVIVVATVAGVAIYQQRAMILGLGQLTVPQIASYLVEMLLWTTLKIAAALCILAILDYGFQRWRHEQDLRMSSQEVREELKNLEGNPQVAARRRVVQRQLLLNRLSTSVPKADVVVTNPTELAIAIQYDPETMPAPIVVAKGSGLLALRIRNIALEHDIPIVERKPLARALYREVEVNQPIPHDKYTAVAEILAYVYQLKGKTIPGAPAS